MSGCVLHVVTFYSVYTLKHTSQHACSTLSWFGGGCGPFCRWGCAHVCLQLAAGWWLPADTLLCVSCTNFEWMSLPAMLPAYTCALPSCLLPRAPPQTNTPPKKTPLHAQASCCWAW